MTRAAAPRRLIVSADDFGMSPGVNAGIIRAHRDGILTDASLMVNGGACAEAVALAHANPTLSVGLHLVLAQGFAVLPPADIPLLVAPDGQFGTNAIWNGMRYFFTPGVRAQLRREIRSQLDAFAATGLPLSHVDGHLTMHVHPTVLTILLEMADAYGIRAMRLPREPLRSALRFSRQHLGRKVFEGTVFAILSRYAAARMAGAGVRHPRRMFGMHQTGHVSEAYLLDVIGQLSPGTTELYCHAALDDDEARRWRPPDYDGQGELASLTSARVRAALDSAGVELTTYHELAGADRQR